MEGDSGYQRFATFSRHSPTVGFVQREFTANFSGYCKPKQDNLYGKFSWENDDMHQFSIAALCGLADKPMYLDVFGKPSRVAVTPCSDSSHFSRSVEISLTQAMWKLWLIYRGFITVSIGFPMKHGDFALGTSKNQMVSVWHSLTHWNGQISGPWADRNSEKQRFGSLKLPLQRLQFQSYMQWESSCLKLEVYLWLSMCIYISIWLVVWNIFYDCPYVGNVIITDELHHFSEG